MMTTMFTLHSITISTNLIYLFIYLIILFLYFHLLFSNLSVTYQLPFFTVTWCQKCKAIHCFNAVHTSSHVVLKLVTICIHEFLLLPVLLLLRHLICQIYCTFETGRKKGWRGRKNMWNYNWTLILLHDTKKNYA